MRDTVIFDMDGTLIDSEKYYNRCWVRAITEAGYSVTREQALEFRSLGRPFAPEYFRQLFGGDFDYYAVRQRRKELVEEMIRQEGLSLKPGVHEILDALRERGMRAMIATATDLERTGRYLGKLGILDCFDRIISAVMVPEGKPAPDIYLYACREAGRDPSDCIAVEDAPNGIRSAAAAGCYVVMIPDLSQPDEELAALVNRREESLLTLADWIRRGMPDSPGPLHSTRP